MGSYLSVITLNVNGLNAPTKRQRLAEWIQKHPGLPRRIPVLYWLEALSWELPGVSQRVTGGRLSWDSAPAAERRLQEVWDPQTRLTAVCPFPDDLFITNAPLCQVMLIMGPHWARVGSGAVWEVSVPSSQLCCKPTTTLKN